MTRVPLAPATCWRIGYSWGWGWGAIMLMLLLDGLWSGIKANVTAYQDNVGADLYVTQPGTRNFVVLLRACRRDFASHPDRYSSTPSP